MLSCLFLVLLRCRRALLSPIEATKPPAIGQCNMANGRIMRRLNFVAFSAPSFGEKNLPAESCTRSAARGITRQSHFAATLCRHVMEK